ncbi:MAG: hypothetical protein L0Z53_21905 [Acidobacteriales bacterium]|nr:hypothetical protein [Terriglobales bacterium]
MSNTFVGTHLRWLLVIRMTASSRARACLLLVSLIVSSEVRAQGPCCTALNRVAQAAREAMLNPPSPGNLGTWKSAYAAELHRVRTQICLTGNVQSQLDALIRTVNALTYLDKAKQAYITGIKRNQLFSSIPVDLDAIGKALPCGVSAGPSAGSPAGGGAAWPCPGTDNLEKIGKHAERAATVAKAGAQVAEDPQIKSALEQTADALEKVSAPIDKAVRLGNACALIHDFVTAVQAINGAGCDSMKLAKGFDQLFRSAGAIGQKLPLDAVSKQYFSLLASNQSFFQRTSKNVIPEQRWARQFKGVDGYLPGGCAGAP